MRRTGMLLMAILLGAVLLSSPGCSSSSDQNQASGGQSTRDPQSATDQASVGLTQAQVEELEKVCGQVGVPGTSGCPSAVAHVLSQPVALAEAEFRMDVGVFETDQTTVTITSTMGKPSCDEVAPHLCAGITLNEKVALPVATATTSGPPSTATEPEPTVDEAPPTQMSSGP